MSKTLQQQIQSFYDASSGLWEQVWGEHMHHGYYGPDGSEEKDRRQAQIDLIEELLQWGGVTQARAIVDVGCGIGGSSLYLAEKFGAIATGITLSPVQARRATERAAAAGLADHAQFQVVDALSMPFADSSFDLAWSMESGEHMPDKTQFLRECYRVLEPGGTFLMATWCHRPIQDMPLTAEEQAHLEKIYRVYRLPYIISLAEYAAIAESLNYRNVRIADWSEAVAPFWDEVVRSAISPGAVVGLLRSGWSTVQAALSMGLMQTGYRRGLVRFGVLVGQR